MVRACGPPQPLIELSERPYPPLPLVVGMRLWSARAVERHIAEVLVPQGHLLVVTSRPEGLSRTIVGAASWLSLCPLDEAQQRQLIEMRVAERARVEQLLVFARTRLLPDTQTGESVLASPLMLSMVVSTFSTLTAASASGYSPSSNVDAAPPTSTCSLYAMAASRLLASVERDEHHTAAPTGGEELVSRESVRLLCDAIFFRAHAAGRTLIEEFDIDAAALELGAPQ